VTSSQGDHLEIEQKYDVDDDFVLPQLTGSVLEGRKATRPARYFLSATYYDTEDLDLLAAKTTLRRRVGGTDEGWHLKQPVRKDVRQERHEPLGDNDTGTVPARLAAEVADIVAGKRLRPVAVLDTERTVVRVTGKGGQPLAEIADDRVTAIRFGPDGDQEFRWREVEVEALSDEPSVPRLAGQIGEALRTAGARPSASASKLARVLQS
jgi:inorganic triphosphatase YgiF